VPDGHLKTRERTVSRTAQSVKRLEDVVISLAALVATLPLWVLAGALVWITTGRPMLFRQVRPGLHGRPFTLLKFRTMNPARDADGRLLPDVQRITPIGRILRRTSLDELPQLWNVLRGEMSLVGPRPLLVDYLERYTPEQARRHEVRPGITGLAQINGRTSLHWDDAFALDCWYVDNRSLQLDHRILAHTVALLISGKGAAQPVSARPEFRGPP
jgi:lipopolysaccharide/colanic/teichoic acid biosynthesis glycosyltransferase